MYSFPRSLVPPPPLPAPLFGPAIDARIEIDIWAYRHATTTPGTRWHAEAARRLMLARAWDEALRLRAATDMIDRMVRAGRAARLGRDTALTGVGHAYRIRTAPGLTEAPR